MICCCQDSHTLVYSECAKMSFLLTASRCGLRACEAPTLAPQHWLIVLAAVHQEFHRVSVCGRGLDTLRGSHVDFNTQTSSIVVPHKLEGLCTQATIGRATILVMGKYETRTQTLVAVERSCAGGDARPGHMQWRGYGGEKARIHISASARHINDNARCK